MDSAPINKTLMRWQLLFSLTSLAGASPVQVSAADTASPKVLHYKATIPSQPLKKRSAVKDSLVNDIYGVTIPLYLGSDLQEVPVSLDTGSWLTWVSARNFDVNTSTTATKLPTAFSFEYLNANVSGWHYNDTFANSPNGDESVYIGFGLAEAGSMLDVYHETGLLGLAENPVPGNDFIGQLQASGFIESRSYSFWLADPNHGSITFGGVDLSKTSSEFTKLPSSGISIYVQKFKGTLHGQEILFGEGNNFTCSVDSGSSGTFLPTGVVTTLMNAYGAVWTNNNTEAQAANMTKDQYSIKYQGGGTLKFDSCGFEFEVPLWRFLGGVDNTQVMTSEPEIGQWYNLNIYWADTFCLFALPSVYMEYVIAFDVDNQTIGFAKNNPAFKDDEGPSALSGIGKGGIGGSFAPSTQLATLGSDFTVYSTASFTTI